MPILTAPESSRLTWMTVVCAPWDRIHWLDPSLALCDSKRALTYILPPLHLFFAKGDVHTQKMHNWVCIREWCIFESYVRLDHVPVLMTSAQWRVVLKGHYYAIYYPLKASIQPQLSRADIAHLYPPPPGSTSLSKCARTDT